MRRRVIALAVVIAALTAACGGGGSDEDRGPSKVGSAFDDVTSTTKPGDAGTDPAGEETPGGPATTAARGNGSSGNNAASRPSRTTAAPPPPGAPGSPGPGAPAPSGATPLTGADGPPGAFARSVLRPQPATTIVFERMQQSGAEPRPASLEHATSVLGRVSGKPVDTPAPIAIPGDDRDWTDDEIRATARQLTKGGGEGRAVLHILFLRGTFEGTNQVLGVAVEGDVLAVFADSVAAASTPVVSAAVLEDAVLMHELGHLLGLVDLARNTGRADPEHPGHSRNRGSVMYWAVESSLVTQVLQGGPPRDFDADDLADLRALREGA